MRMGYEDGDTAQPAPASDAAHVVATRPAVRAIKW